MQINCHKPEVSRLNKKIYLPSFCLPTFNTVFIYGGLSAKEFYLPLYSLRLKILLLSYLDIELRKIEPDNKIQLII